MFLKLVKFIFFSKNIVNIKSKIHHNVCFVNVKENVGNTVNATFRENISQGTKGVPLNAVMKWFKTPIRKVRITVIYKLNFIFPVIK